MLRRISTLLLLLWACERATAQGGADCASALAAPITLPFSGIGLTNCGSVNDYDSGNSTICGSALYMGGEDHLYAFTPDTSGIVTITVESISSYMALLVYEGCPGAGGVCLAPAFSAGGDQFVLAPVDSGITYFIMIDSWPAPPCHAAYDLSISAPDGSILPTISDCLGAQVLCAAQHVELDTMFGEGNYPDEINSGSSCLGGGEVDGYWYLIVPQNSDSLCFSIIPNDAGDDYDWAVYDLTNANCLDIYTDPALEISCNFSGLPGETGANGQPGAQHNPCLSVSTGQALALYVSNWSQSPNGFMIDLNVTGNQVSVTDTTPPLLSGDTVQCVNAPLSFHFDGPLSCSSVQAADIAIFGQGGPYAVNSFSSSACDAGSVTATDLELTTTPPLTPNAWYTLFVIDTIADACGNLTTSDSLTFWYSDAPTASFIIFNDTLLLPDTAINVTNTSSDSVACNWFINGVLASTDCSPQLLLGAQPDTVEIALTVWNVSGCPDTYVDSVIVLSGMIDGIPGPGPGPGTPETLQSALANTRDPSSCSVEFWDASGRLILRIEATALLAHCTTGCALGNIIDRPGIYAWRLTGTTSGGTRTGRAAVL